MRRLLTPALTTALTAGLVLAGAGTAEAARPAPAPTVTVTTTPLETGPDGCTWQVDWALVGTPRKPLTEWRYENAIFPIPTDRKGQPALSGRFDPDVTTVNVAGFPGESVYFAIAPVYAGKVSTAVVLDPLVCPAA